ncbi:MAG: N-acetylmuramoyl-L-alanine amidase [Clostridia bacterium]|nr:N-acetylmuramoyl-L-alanine amidase [Clostridia bacterium]
MRNNDILKRFGHRLIALLVICIIASIGFVKKAVVSTASTHPVMLKTVILDPGHGGFDGGASSADGTLEKDINLLIALKLKDFLVFSGYDVVMTRTEDTGTEDNSEAAIASRKKSDLKNRLSLMQNAVDAIYVSIHLNKFTTSAASGTQVFYTPNFESAKALGECIQKSVVSLLQPENRRVIKRGTDSTYLLKNATVPAVIVECGFLSNKGDLEKLKDESYQSKLAFCIASGINEYFKCDS